MPDKLSRNITKTEKPTGAPGNVSHCSLRPKAASAAVAYTAFLPLSPRESRLPLPQTPPAAPHSCPHSGLRASAPRSSRSPARPPPPARLAARGPPAPISKHDNNRDAGNNNYHQPGDGAPPEGQRSAPRATEDPRDSREPAVVLTASLDPLTHHRPSFKARPRSSRPPQPTPEPFLSLSRPPDPRDAPRPASEPALGPSWPLAGPPRPTDRPLAAHGPPRGTRGVGQRRRPQGRRNARRPPGPPPPRSPAPLTRLRGRRGSAAERRRGAGAAHAARGRVSRAARPGREGGVGARAGGCGECGAGGMQARPRRAGAHAGPRRSRGRYCGGVWPRTPPRRLPGWGPRSIALCRGRPLAPGPSGGCGGRRPHESLPPIGSPYPPPPLARPAERQGPLTSRRRGNAMPG
ncbi:basic proline-rich protein-like [Mus caroli]|uniref:Basic proline-rich protein-like n=1 Tax=Mus caroli TaxID=10089 RepID=A0A6P5Q9V9_MUSCR|nr:basic proline-rich protein-like [Mus caroli]